MAKNNRFFFRTSKLENPEDSFVDVPSDLEWAVNPSQVKPVDRQEKGGMPNNGDRPGIPSFGNAGKLETPVLEGIAKQEVSQDKEGRATVDVTFNIRSTQNDVEFEMRITR